MSDQPGDDHLVPAAEATRRPLEDVLVEAIPAARHLTATDL